MVTVLVYCICCACHVISAKIAVGDFLFILRIKKINHDQFVVIPCVCEVYAPWLVMAVSVPWSNHDGVCMRHACHGCQLWGLPWSNHGSKVSLHEVIMDKWGLMRFHEVPWRNHGSEIPWSNHGSVNVVLIDFPYPVYRPTLFLSCILILRVGSRSWP